MKTILKLAKASKDVRPFAHGFNVIDQIASYTDGHILIQQSTTLANGFYDKELKFQPDYKYPDVERVLPKFYGEIFYHEITLPDLTRKAIKEIGKASYPLAVVVEYDIDDCLFVTQKRNDVMPYNPYFFQLIFELEKEHKSKDTRYLLHKDKDKLLAVNDAFKLLMMAMRK